MKGLKLLIILGALSSVFGCDFLDLKKDKPSPPEPADNKIVVNISGNIDNQTTDWAFGEITNVSIPDQEIDSIVLSVPLRSSKIDPFAEAILFDSNADQFINSSRVMTTFRYTIEHKRSTNLKGYFYPGNYGLKIGLRSSGSINYTKVSGPATLTIYLAE